MSSDAKHDYHLVDPSPWPVVGSIGAFVMMVGATFWMHADYTRFWGLPVNGTPWIFIVGLGIVLYTMLGWWRDVIKESVHSTAHTPVVKLHLRYGMLLFIASEVMFSWRGSGPISTPRSSMATCRFRPGRRPAS